MEAALTPRMERIYSLRRGSRMSFEEIGRALGITRQTAHESYQRALYYYKEAQEKYALPDGVTLQDIQRMEEMEFIETILERYMRLADSNEMKKPRTAIEALNGAHRYLDSLIKIKGINAPVKVQHTVSNDALEAELLKIKAELANVIDAEVVEEARQIDA